MVRKAIGKIYPIPSVPGKGVKPGNSLQGVVWGARNATNLSLVSQEFIVPKKFRGEGDKIQRQRVTASILRWVLRLRVRLLCRIRNWRLPVVIAALLAAHLYLLLDGIRWNFVTVDESGHVPSGLAHWQTGSFAAYRVIHRWRGCWRHCHCYSGPTPTTKFPGMRRAKL